jgi:hypothetical protein
MLWSWLRRDKEVTLQQRALTLDDQVSSLNPRQYITHGV